MEQIKHKSPIDYYNLDKPITDNEMYLHGIIEDMWAKWQGDKRIAIKALTELNKINEPKKIIGYTDEEIKEFTPVEKRAYDVICGYNPRGHVNIIDRTWLTYDQYSVLEMMCNFID